MAEIGADRAKTMAFANAQKGRAPKQRALDAIGAGAAKLNIDKAYDLPELQNGYFILRGLENKNISHMAPNFLKKNMNLGRV